MGIFDFFKKKKENEGLTAGDIFKDEKVNYDNTPTCSDCSVSHICQLDKNEKGFLCGFTQKIENYDENKPSILLFDDNLGVISFLMDDLEELEEEGFIKLSDYNILQFSSQYAAFQLQATLKAYNGLNIKYGIFDITLGGGVYDEKKGNIILDGVDAFISVEQYNPCPVGQ